MNCSKAVRWNNGKYFPTPGFLTFGYVKAYGSWVRSLTQDGANLWALRLPSNSSLLSLVLYRLVCFTVIAPIRMLYACLGKFIINRQFFFLYRYLRFENVKKNVFGAFSRLLPVRFIRFMQNQTFSFVLTGFYKIHTKENHANISENQKEKQRQKI